MLISERAHEGSSIVGVDSQSTRDFSPVSVDQSDVHLKSFSVKRITACVVVGGGMTALVRLLGAEPSTAIITGTATIFITSAASRHMGRPRGVIQAAGDMFWSTVWASVLMGFMAATKWVQKD